jgi:hypothetical protein
MNSDEVVRLPGHLPVAIGNPACRMGRPADGDALVADRDVGMVVGGLGGVREPVHERDRSREAVEHELPLERAVGLRPVAHARQYGVFRRSHIGYSAGNRIIGISKLTRLVRLFARRFTVELRMV